MPNRQALYDDRMALAMERDGVASIKAEYERLRNQAKKEFDYAGLGAEKMKNDAEAQADKIVSDAEKTASALIANVKKTIAIIKCFIFFPFDVYIF